MALVLIGGQGEPSPPRVDSWKLVGVPPSQDEAAHLQESLRTGCDRIERYFGHSFRKPFEVEVFPDRSKFDEYFDRRWKAPKTQAWMVASGVADKLTILSKDVWKSQAVEHDPANREHYRLLIAHELVHVYHGQHNPTGDFDGLDELGWFVEGLAVYVSGQLDTTTYRDAARQALDAGQAPKSLAKAWSGRYRYGVAGSMVQYVEKKWGKAMVLQLLTETKLSKLLETLKVTEQEFLSGWTEHVSAPNR